MGDQPAVGQFLAGVEQEMVFDHDGDRFRVLPDELASRRIMKSLPARPRGPGVRLPIEVALTGTRESEIAAGERDDGS